MAEAVTQTGQLITRSAELAVNAKIKQLAGYDHAVYYADTDSVGLKFYACAIDILAKLKPKVVLYNLFQRLWYFYLINTRWKWYNNPKCQYPTLARRIENLAQMRQSGNLDIEKGVF